MYRHRPNGTAMVVDRLVNDMRHRRRYRSILVPERWSGNASLRVVDGDWFSYIGGRCWSLWLDRFVCAWCDVVLECAFAGIRSLARRAFAGC